MPFREAVDIVRDTEKGAAQLALEAVESVLELGKEEEVEDYLIELVEGRPSMAPLLNLANSVFISLEKEEDPWGEAEKFRKKLIIGRKKSSETMRELIKGLHVLTLSYSSTVKMSLKVSPRVSILESRPLMEGRRMAEELAASGSRVTYWCDPGVLPALEDVDAVVVGADAFSEEHFVNKVGTGVLSLCCEKLKIPFYVVTDCTKFLPNEIPLIHQEMHDTSEVWEDAPHGVRVENPYFEKVPWGDDILVNESGINVFPSTEISDRLSYHFSRSDDGLC